MLQGCKNLFFRSKAACKEARGLFGCRGWAVRAPRRAAPVYRPPSAPRQGAMDAVCAEAAIALDCIAQVHWTELQRCESPSESVQLLVCAVLRLAGFKEKEAKKWETARALIGAPSFMVALDSFRDASILADSSASGKLLQLLEKYMSMPALRPENVDPCVQPLLIWCHAVHRLLAARHVSRLLGVSTTAHSTAYARAVKKTASFLQREGVATPSFATRVAGAAGNGPANDTLDPLSAVEAAGPSVQAESPTGAAENGQGNYEQILRSAVDVAAKECGELRNQVRELKSMVRPPRKILLILEALCITLSVDYLEWDKAKKVLSPDLMHTLSEFHLDAIRIGQIRKLKKYVENEELAPAARRHVSSAADGLYKWVVAVYRYQLHIASQQGVCMTPPPTDSCIAKSKRSTSNSMTRPRSSGAERANIHSVGRRPPPPKRPLSAQIGARAGSCTQRRPATATGGISAMVGIPAQKAKHPDRHAVSAARVRTGSGAHEGRRLTCPEARRSMHRATSASVSQKGTDRIQRSVNGAHVRKGGSGLLEAATAREEDANLAERLYCAERRLGELSEELALKQQALDAKTTEILRLRAQLEKVHKQHGTT